MLFFNRRSVKIYLLLVGQLNQSQLFLPIVVLWLAVSCHRQRVMANKHKQWKYWQCLFFSRNFTDKTRQILVSVKFGFHSTTMVLDSSTYKRIPEGYVEHLPSPAHHGFLRSSIPVYNLNPVIVLWFFWVLATRSHYISLMKLLPSMVPITGTS